MLTYKRSCISLFAAFVLIVSCLFPCPVSAAMPDTVEPCASYYLTSYSAYVYVTDSGEVQVWFDVMGTGWMDEIGALSIMLYESSDGVNWTWIETFLHEECDTMLFCDDWYISSHVSCQGSTNRQYKAYVCVWAGKNGDGDSRYFWAYQP